MQVRKNVLGLMVLSAGILIQGCKTFEPGATADEAKEGVLKGAIDDRVMTEKLLTEVKKRLEDKTLTPGDTLRSQLGRRTTQVTFAQPHTRRLPLEEQYAYGRASVVIMGSVYKCGKCSNLHLSTAAGFAVAEDGVFLTNYHVVAGVTNSLGMVAVTAEGEVAGVTEVLATNPIEDWALILIPELKLKPLPLKGNVSVGTEVFLVSHPNQHFFSYGNGNVARYGKGRVQVTRASNKAVTSMYGTEWLEITAEFAKGASGGPVMDSCGNVVGLISRVEGRKIPENSEDHGLGTMVFKQCTPIALVIKGGSVPRKP